MNKYTVLALIVLVVAMCPKYVEAGKYSLGSTGFELSGDQTITFRELDKHSSLNRNFRGDDPFSNYRTRLFIARKWNENIKMNIEVLFDNNNKTRINGSYLTFSNLVTSNFSAKVGLIPSPFGNFSHRSTYFNQNPVIGVPAMWHYISPLSKGGGSTNESFYPRKTKNAGVPSAYDACWPTGVSLHGDFDLFEGNIALTHNTISNPKAYLNDGYEGIITLGIKPSAGPRTGLSFAYGPWIGSDHEPAVAISNKESYMQNAIGIYLEYSVGHWLFFSEVMDIEWETPHIYEGKVSLQTGYGEFRWNLIPGWYLGGRFDFMQYDDISTTNDGTGIKKMVLV